MEFLRPVAVARLLRSQWNVVYCVMSPPVAERTSSRSIANACAVDGTSSLSFASPLL